jgi:hypothetical protein
MAKNNKAWWIFPVMALATAGFVLYERYLNKVWTAPTVDEELNVLDHTFDCDEKSASVIKSHITRTINQFAHESKWFEIGKTGQVAQRSGFYKEGKMILLAKSKFRETIEKLEDYYKEKYAANSKNTDKNDDSNSRMESDDGLFYLYVVVG